MLKPHEKLLRGLVREPPEGQPILGSEMCTGPASRCNRRRFVTVFNIQQLVEVKRQ